MNTFALVISILLSLCASRAGGCCLESCNASTAVPGPGGHNQGKLGSGISLGDLHLVLWLYKLELLVGVDVAMMMSFGISLV